LAAAYALGLISGKDDATPDGKDLDRSMRTHRFGCHVGAISPHTPWWSRAQDTITGFSLEDNNLWRRHLLNLVVQVALALYIFWKSTSGPNKKFLATSILLFVRALTIQTLPMEFISLRLYHKKLYSPIQIFYYGVYPIFLSNLVLQLY
jgi:hypothetical protein